MVPFTIGRGSDVAVFIIGIYLPRLGCIAELEVYNFLDLFFDSRIKYGKANLYPLVEIAVHKIGRTKVDFFLAIVVKDPYPRMFQIAVYNTAEIDIFTVTGYLRHKTADAPHNQVDPDAFVACLIHLLYQLFVGQGIHLKNNGSRTSGACMFYFPVDQLQEPGPRFQR